LGADHYYNLGQNWEARVNNPDPQYAIRVFQSLESMRLMGMPPTVLEFPGGSAADWPPITPQDIKACLMMHLAYGMKGLNYYIFTGGPNPPGLGKTTDIYDYHAAIGSKGEIGGLYETEQSFMRFVNQNQWLNRARRAYDCRVAYDYRMQRADQYWSNKGDYKLTDAAAFTFLQRGLLNTLFCQGYSPNLVDLNADDWTKDKQTPVLIVSSSAMAADEQTRIVDFIKSGGNALIVPVIPEYDEQFQPCTILKDFLGCKAIAENKLIGQRLDFASVKNVFMNEASFTTPLPANAVLLGKDSAHQLPISWERQLPGQGKAIFLGFKWNYAMNEQRFMLDELLKRFGTKRMLDVSNQNVFTSVRTDGHNTMLFLISLYTSPMETEVTYHNPFNGNIEKTGLIKLEPMSVATVILK
jgi:beta-galactosidase